MELQNNSPLSASPTVWIPPGQGPRMSHRLTRASCHLQASLSLPLPGLSCGPSICSLQGLGLWQSPPCSRQGLHSFPGLLLRGSGLAGLEARLLSAGL